MSPPSKLRVADDARMLTLAFALIGIQGADDGGMNVARDFIAKLSPELRARAVFRADSDDRFDWHYVPRDRVGVAWSDMSAEQSERGKELLRHSLSEAGYARIEQIRHLETILRERENNPGRDERKYFFTFYGEPSASGFWMWRYEGHHVSLSFAYLGSDLIGSTPQFLGSNPVALDQPGSPLGKTRDLALKLLESLSPEQQELAIVSDTAPFDIVSEAKRHAMLESREGISFSQLTEDQQQLLLSLADAHADVQRPSEAARRRQALEAENPETLVFAWMGGVTPRSRHYYRIHGEDVLIEFDSTQSDGEHIHTVWRSLHEDFGGEDPLATHRRRHHH